MPDAEFVLRIILRARDEMAGALAKARGELALLTSQSQTWRNELKRLNGELDNFFGRLDKFSKRATHNLRDEIQANRQATSSSGVLASAVGKLGDEEEKMGRKVRTASSEVRKGSSDLRRLKSNVDPTRNSVERFGQEMLNSSRNMKTWGDNIGSTHTKLRGLLVAGALIFIQQLNTAVVGLAGGLVELAGSAGMAAGALGGILAAGAAQALPVVLELAAAVHRVSMVWNVVQQQNKVNQQQAYRNMQNTKQEAGAADSLANAQDGVAQAHRQVGVAEEALSKARRQAVRDIQDLNEAARQSIIQEEQASLAQEDARKALSDALAAGDIDAARRARIQLEEANLSEQKAKIDRQRAIADANTANRQGVGRNPQVVAAQRALEDAARGVTTAERGLKKARTDAHAANQDMFAAKSNLQYMLSQLSPAEKRLYRSLTNLQHAYKQAFRPITDTIIGSFTFAVDRGEKILKSPALLGAANVLANSISARIRGVVRSFTDPQTLGQFFRFTLEAARNLKPIESIADNVGHLFLNIAQDALPAFHTFVTDLDKWTKGWNEWIASNPEKVTGFFSTGEKHLEAWLSLAGAVIKLFAAITGAGGAQSGLTLIERLTNSLNKATKWVQYHRQQVHSFFDSVNIVLDTLANTVRVLGGAMLTLFNPERLQNFAQFFNHTLLPAITLVAQTLGFIADWFLRIANLPGFHQLTILLLTMGITAKALRGPWDLLLGSIGRVVKAVGGYIEALKVARVWAAAFFRADSGVNLFGRWGKAKQAVNEYTKAQQLAAAQAAETTAVIKEEQIIASKPTVPIFGPRGNVISNVSKEAGAGATAAERTVGTEIAGGAAAAEGSIVSGVAGSLGGLALGGLGLAAGMAVINGFSDTFSSKANQLDFGGHVQEFLHGATFGIIPSAAEEQAKLYVKALSVAVSGKMNDPETRKRFAPPPLPSNFRGTPSGFRPRQTVGTSNDPADIVDPQHKLSDHQRQIIEDIARFQKAFQSLRGAGATTFSALSDQLKAYEQKYPEAQGAVDRLLKHIENFHKRVASIAQGQADVFDFSNALQLDPSHAKKITDNFIDELKKLSPRARVEAAKTARGVVAGLASQGKLPKDVAAKIDDDVSSSLAHMRRRARAQSGKAAQETSQNLAIMLNSVGLMNHSFVGQINKILDGLGVSKKAVASWANIAARAIPGGVGALLGGLIDTTAGGGQATGGRARGWVGKAGQRGKDSVVSILGKGEAVLNWGHQRMVEPAMRAYWGMGLDDMFQMRSSYHAGGAGQFGFAGGGFVNNVGAHVDTDGEKRIAAALDRLGKAMGITFSPAGPRSARRTPSENAAVGGAAGSMHLLGRAMDVAPEIIKSIANSVLHKFGLDRPMPGNWVDASGNVHDERNHLVLFGGGRGGGGAQGAGAAIAKSVDTHLRRMHHVPGGGVESAIVNKLIDRVNRAGQRFVDRQANTSADFSSVKGGGGNAEANRRLGRSLMLKMWGPDQWPFLNKLWTQESGWNENADNPTSTAIGIPQDITGDRHGGARGQIIWGLKYIKQRYGTPAAAWAHEIANNWYDKGGIIPGAWGSAVNIIAHGGEWILNKAQQARAAAMAGLSREGLRGALGFTGGPTHFQGGGEIGTGVENQAIVKKILSLLLIQAGSMHTSPTGFQRSRTTIGSVSGIAGDIKLNFADISDAIRHVEKSLRNLNTHGAKGVKSVEKKLSGLQRSGGLFDKLAGSVEAMDKAMTRGLNARAFAINKAGQVVQRVSTSQIHSEQLNNLVTHYNALAGEKGVLTTALKDNAAQIKDAEHELKTAKGSKAKAQAKRALADLRSFRTNIEDRIQTVTDDMQQAMQDRLQAQIQVQQDIVDGINKAFSQRSDVLNSAQRIATALGQTGISKTIADAQVELLKNQRDALQGRIQEARAAGANDLADQLESQVQDLNASIVEAVQQNIQNAIDQINQSAQRRLGNLDLFGRMADALGQVGLGGAGATVGGVTLTRSGIFDARNNVLTDQRSQLQAQLAAIQALPEAQQNQKAIADLTDQLNELDVTIQENTRAAFQARIDDVTAQADFALSINDLNRQIIDAQGAISGNTDQVAEASNLQERGNILQDEHNKLQALYNEAVSRNDQKAQNDLTLQLKQNELAQLENTKALADVNGSLNTQQLSTTAWQQFRSAIFGSMGNLLPQYQIPAMNTPAMWSSSSDVSMNKPVIHKTVNEGDITVNVTEPTEVLDPDYVAHVVAFNRGSSSE